MSWPVVSSWGIDCTFASPLWPLSWAPGSNVATLVGATACGARTMGIATASPMSSLLMAISVGMTMVGILAVATGAATGASLGAAATFCSLGCGSTLATLGGALGLGGASFFFFLASSCNCTT